MPELDVHVACARTDDIAPQDWPELGSWLDDDERERAKRFRFEADRHAYVLAHVLLRALIAGVTGRAATSLRLSRDQRGKPGVEGEPRLHISNSHARRAAACAVTLAGPVGIDVEAIDARNVDRELLNAYVVGEPSSGERQFFERWALLEAFWKARGTGLAQDNARIAISTVEGQRLKIRTEGSDTGSEGCGWLLECFDDCAAALVLRIPPQHAVRLYKTRCSSAWEIKQLSKVIQVGRLRRSN